MSHSMSHSMSLVASAKMYVVTMNNFPKKKNIKEKEGKMKKLNCFVALSV